jgi:hypothetical protein
MGKSGKKWKQKQKQKRKDGRNAKRSWIENRPPKKAA